MRIGVVGGGINGLAVAWVLARRGHEVALYERHELMRGTSSASSKLLHGGFRYLENGEFRLVRESLRERDAWFRRAPAIAVPLSLIFPIYRDGQRSRLLVRMGFSLYDLLAGRSALPAACWLDADKVLTRSPELNPDGLLGGYLFQDGRMDDRTLGLWVAGQAQRLGARIYEGQEVARVDKLGGVMLAGGDEMRFDRVVNAAGPWAINLLDRSGISSRYQLDLVRGSHLVLDQSCHQALLLEVPDDHRVFFVLPWKENTLVGTTEVRQKISESVRCTHAEQSYLLRAYGHYFPLSPPSVLNTFSGLRPLIKSSADAGKATREYAVERQGSLLNILGGKWTTAVALAKKVSRIIH